MPWPLAIRALCFLTRAAFGDGSKRCAISASQRRRLRGVTSRTARVRRAIPASSNASGIFGGDRFLEEEVKAMRVGVVGARLLACIPTWRFGIGGVAR